jgi:hypothetical protein
MMSMSDRTNVWVRAGQRRKRRLWLLIGAIVIAGGALDAILLPMARHPADAVPVLPPAAAVIAAAILVLLLWGGTWLYFRVADELERTDNLVAFSMGFVFNIGAYIAWYMLSLGGLASRPEAQPLFISTAGVSALVYVWLKLRRGL